MRLPTTILATCPHCHDEVRVDSRRLRLIVNEAHARYEFTCPECGVRAVKPACEQVVDLLLSGGITAEVEVVPQEALEPHYGRTLTEDDLIDFGRELAKL